MTIGKLVRHLLFPGMWLLILLLPLAVVGLAYGMLYLPETDVRRIALYVLSAYTLTIWCVRMPSIMRFFRQFRRENPYANRWLTDPHLRMRVTLTGNVLWNSGYALLQLGLGFYHHTAWFYALAIYYASLAVMRFFLMRHTLSHGLGEDVHRELIQYRTCGIVFLFMNLALSAMLFYMLYENRLVRHHEITTIAMATYTFTTLTLAIYNLVKCRRSGWDSPVLEAARCISLAAACVSMLTLEGTMLVTFGGEDPVMIHVFLILSGSAVSVGIVAMAVYMLVKSNRRIKTFGGQDERK